MTGGADSCGGARRGVCRRQFSAGGTGSARSPSPFARLPLLLPSSITPFLPYTMDTASLTSKLDQVALDSIDKPTPSAKKHLPGAGTVSADGETSAYFTRVRTFSFPARLLVAVLVVALIKSVGGRIARD